MNRTLKYVRIIICWLAVAVWMCLIFSMSSNDADVSTEQSGAFIRTLSSVFYRDFSELSADEQSQIVAGLQTVVRKLAHFTEYFGLGALLCLAIGNHIKKRMPLYLLSVSVGSVYAITDELHQLTVPGRAGQVTDVLLDSLGVSVGAAFAVGAIALAASCRKRRLNSNK